MAVYAISDLHLSLNSNKPMDVFGELWRDHHLKIMEKWVNKINDDDIILIAGDISWAMKLEDALPDLEYIHNLKGKKIIIKGNHDFWWNSITKLNTLYNDIYFLQNTAYIHGEYGICGTRGWINIDSCDEGDEKVYRREILRLKMSLDEAILGGAKKIIVMMHYPPITRVSRAEEFLTLLSSYPVEKVVYGHIHNDSREICYRGFYSKIEFICTSADIIDFDPIRII